LSVLGQLESVASTNIYEIFYTLHNIYTLSLSTQVMSLLRFHIIVTAFVLLNYLLITEAVAQPTVSPTNDAGRNGYLYSRRLYDEGYYDMAAEQLERVLRDHPGLADADEAQFLLGESYIHTGELKRARAAFLRLAIIFPDSPRAPEAMLKVGIILEQLEHLIKASQAYRRVHDFYPKSPQSILGLTHAMEIHVSIGDSIKAEIIADLLIKKYPHSDAADIARLNKAVWMDKRGNQTTARAYLKRIAERTNVDSLAIKALLELGRICQSNMELDAAVVVYCQAIQRDNKESASHKASLQLADLLNYRGLPDEALAILEHLLKDSSHSKIMDALERAGDAYYRKGDLLRAFAFYQRSTLPDARLKAAWTAERNGDARMALDIYIELSQSDIPVSKMARLRAAQIAVLLNEYDRAMGLWWEVVRDSVLADSFGRAFFELGLLNLKVTNMDSLNLVTEIVNSMVSRYPQSPYHDDLTYIEALTNEKLGNYNEAIEVYLTIIKDFPASPFSDSSLAAIEFINRCYIRSEQLMERMAELSSTPQGTISPVRWALEWGDFYLNDLKDQVRAIDQYDYVLADSIATEEQRKHAFYHSGEAYLQLFQIAIREADSVAIELYSDSVHVRLLLLENADMGSDDALMLRTNLSMSDFSHVVLDNNSLDRFIDTSKVVFDIYGIEHIKPEWIITYLESALQQGRIDSANQQEWFKLVDGISAGLKDERNKARIELFKIKLMAATGSLDLATDTAAVLIKQWQQTPAGAQAMWWMIEHAPIKPDKKLDFLIEYHNKYYYLLDPEIEAQITASLLDSLEKPLKALKTREYANAIAKWGQPELNILSIPNESGRFRRAQAYFKSDSLYRAALEYRSLLNMTPHGEFAAQSLLGLVRIYTSQGFSEIAISYLDTLELRFPYSDAASYGEHIRPGLEFGLERYSEARKGYLTLSERESEPDSIFYFTTQSVVCLYRQNKLEEAFKSAKELYKKFKKREDLDNVKALFFLEKGRSYDRVRDFENARKLYAIVQNKYLLTPWVDDAAYASGLSFIAQDRFEDSAVILELFKENYPESNLIPDVQLSLGLTYLRAEKYDKAIITLKQAWEDLLTKRVWMPAFRLLMDVYRNAHFWDAAIKLNREYLSRFPNAEDILDRRMEIGQLYLQIGEWDEAVRHYRPLLETADAERGAEIQYYIGEAYQNKGDYRTAILEFLKVPVLGRKTKLDWGVTAIYQTGICYEELGDIDGATRMYRQIIHKTGATSNYGRTAQKRLEGLDIKHEDE